MIRIAVVDDEKNQVEEITDIVALFCQQQNIEYKIYPFYFGEDLLNCIIPMDIVFLDVRMEKMDGIETAQKLRTWNKSVAVVYITSYQDYIMKAMTIHPFSYITKPFQKDKIIQTMHEFLEYRHSAMQKNPTEYFSVSTDGIARYVEMEDIYYFHYTQDRTILVQMQKKHYTIKSSISSVYNIVNHTYFIMPNPSFIVNVQHIRDIDGKNKKMIMENGDFVFISRRKYQEVLRILNKYITDGGF